MIFEKYFAVMFFCRTFAPNFYTTIIIYRERTAFSPGKNGFLS